MNNVKVVDTKGKFELVSYMHKDLTHYAIRLAGTDVTLESAAPTKTLKGWDLRKEMTQKLLEYSTSGKVVNSPSGFENVTSAVRDIKGLEVGMVITYQIPNNLGNQRFCKITSFGDHFIFCIDPNGEKMFWSKESLKARVEEGIFKIITIEKIPEGLTFPENA